MSPRTYRRKRAPDAGFGDPSLCADLCAHLTQRHSEVMTLQFDPLGRRPAELISAPASTERKDTFVRTSGSQGGIRQWQRSRRGRVDTYAQEGLLPAGLSRRTGRRRAEEVADCRIRRRSCSYSMRTLSRPSNQIRSRVRNLRIP